jgi:hypothetical protein
MKILYNKKLLPLVQTFQEVTKLAELPALPATLSEAAELLNSAPTPEARRARKILLHGEAYGMGPQRFIDVFKSGEN